MGRAGLRQAGVVKKGNREMGKRVAVLMFSLGLGLLMGCSPEYNWREVAVSGGAVKAIFPDKPIIRTRKLDFAGQAVPFTFTMAEVDGTLFAIGYAPLPAGPGSGEPARAAMGRELVRSLYQNMHVPVPAALPGFGTRFTIQSASGGQAGKLQATIWLTPDALVEGIVTGDSKAFPLSQADEFLRSVVVP
jgi:hypothetical protein